jgi:hypothetical protein
VAETGASQYLSLPMFPELTEEQIQYVVGAIKEKLGKTPETFMQKEQPVLTEEP